MKPIIKCSKGHNRCGESLAALPPTVSLVSSVRVGIPGQQARVFIEYIPSNVIDVVRKSLDHTAHGRSLVNDALTCQSLDDAIVEAQAVGTRLLGYVEPQNLLFVFSESAQALAYLPLELPIGDHHTNAMQPPLADAGNQQGADRQKADANACAVVFCYVSNANSLKPLSGCEQEAGEHQANCYQVSWCELEHLKNVLHDFNGHAQSVRGAA